MSEETNKRSKPIPPMTNFDQHHNIPGSITPKESTQRELSKISKLNEVEVENVIDSSIKSKPRQLNLKDPSKIPASLANEPIRKGSNSKSVNIEGPTFPSVTESIEKQENMKKTVIQVPEEQKTATAAEIETIKLDRADDEALEGEFEDDDMASLVESSHQEDIYSQVDDSMEEESEEISSDIPEDGWIDSPIKSQEETSDMYVELTNVSEVELDDEENKPNKESTNEVIADTPDNLPEGTYLEGLTDEEVVDRNTKEAKDLEKRIPISSSPREFTSSDDLTEYIEKYTTTHYRILEGSLASKKLAAPVNVNKGVTIIKRTDRPDFDVEKLRIDQSINDGMRKVQVVCTQSGYSVMCKPMNSRELRTFGRDTRSQTPDTYNLNMAIASSVYSKLTEFSCGALTFEEWLNATSYPDLQTCIFGIYMATYPTINNFNLGCTYCNEYFSVPIGNDTLICIPTGSTTQEMIQEIVYGQRDPRELIKTSKRNTGIDIFFDQNRRFFRVRTPSIIEFYERAYRGKKETVIENNEDDMFYSGYIRGYGILNIEEYNKTGEANYFYDTSIVEIDRAIANLSPEERVVFERRMVDYINKHSVSYQIPRVRCPHCKKIMTQREIHMRTLFFAVRAQKGL